MASTESPFVVEDHVILRLIKIIDKVCSKVLLYVLRQASADKRLSESFLDYYKRKGISEDTLKKQSVSTDQIDLMNKDHNGDSFDVSLLYACLKNGSHGLASSNGKWKEGDITIESCLTRLKNLRNAYIHRRDVSNHNQLLVETEKLKEVLTKILGFAKEIYNLKQEDIDEEVSKRNAEMNEYLFADLVPMAFSKYKHLPVFSEQCKIVNKEGVEEERKLYVKESSHIDTVNHLFDVILPLEEIFTGMKLKDKLVKLGKENEGKDTTFEEILQDEKQRESMSVIVITGIAGVGKTTLIKKILKDWETRDSQMKYLTSYVHLLKTECRNRAIRSFNELLQFVMPHTAQDFTPLNHLKFVVCAQKVLVIIDGIDELNSSSSLLFNEILHVKKAFGIGVLVTTRPEKVNYIVEAVEDLGMTVKLISLVGIPMDKRLTFVSKYHDAIVKKYGTKEDKKRLTNYLERTKHSLSSIWELPYNLALITILWASDNTIVGRIHSESELYREMMRLYKTKLRERLQHSELPLRLCNSHISWVINDFMFNMSKESLIGLLSNQIILPVEAYERLEKVCQKNGVPPEELIGAFLKRISSLTVAYGFSHKGVQEYLAAYYIWLKITGKYGDSDEEKLLRNFEESLFQYSVPASVSQTLLLFLEDQLQKKKSSESFNFSETKTQVERMLRVNYVQENIQTAVMEPLINGIQFTNARELSSISSEGKGVIRSILDDVNGGHVGELLKYQNMLLQLCGMFFLEKSVIADEVKREAIGLLCNSGITEKSHWLRALSNMNCDEYVAEHLIKTEELFQSPVKVNDDNFYAYLALLRAVKPSKQQSGTSILFLLRDELPDLMELFIRRVNDHQFRIKSILVTDKNMCDYESLVRLRKIPVSKFRKLQVEIEVEKEHSNFTSFYQILSKAEYEVTQLTFNHHYKCVTHLHSSEVDVVLDILENSPVKMYRGPMSEKIKKFPKYLENLHVSVADCESFNAFQQMAPSLSHGTKICLCLNANFDQIDSFAPFPVDLNLFLTGANDNNIDRLVDILIRLQPTHEDGTISSYTFPQSTLSLVGIKELVTQMKEKGIQMTMIQLPKRDEGPLDDPNLEEKLAVPKRQEGSIATFLDRFTWSLPGGNRINWIKEKDIWECPEAYEEMIIENFL